MSSVRNPKTCATCGAEFVPSSNAQKRCPPCRSRACATCGIEFTPRRVSYRNCDSCRAPWPKPVPITYSGMHRRVRRIKGAAYGHPCADCGGAAEAWSYANNCSDELTEVRAGYVVAYCPHVEHYSPRCRPCHGLLDLSGERCYRARLSAEDVVTIREDYAARRLTQARLAEKHGVSEHAIYSIVHGKTWKETGGPTF